MRSWCAVRVYEGLKRSALVGMMWDEKVNSGKMGSGKMELGKLDSGKLSSGDLARCPRESKDIIWKILGESHRALNDLLDLVQCINQCLHADAHT